MSEDINEWETIENIFQEQIRKKGLSKDDIDKLINNIKEKSDG